MNSQFTGKMVIDGVIKPLVISISDPVYDAREFGSYYCIVTVAPRFEREMRICGEDADQAQELAVSFVLDVMSKYKVFDAHDREITLTAGSLRRTEQR